MAQIVERHMRWGQADNAMKEVAAIVDGNRCLLIVASAWSDPEILEVIRCETPEAALIEAERLGRRSNIDRGPDFHSWNDDPADQSPRRWSLSQAEADQLAAAAATA